MYPDTTWRVAEHDDQHEPLAEDEPAADRAPAPARPIRAHDLSFAILCRQREFRHRTALKVHSPASRPSRPVEATQIAQLHQSCAVENRSAPRDAETPTHKSPGSPSSALRAHP